MKKTDDTDSSNASGGLVGLLIIGLVIWGGVSLFRHNDHSKPWWTGTETQTACLIGTGCYSLSTESNGAQVTRITFTNGGYVYPAGEATCDKDDTVGRFCDFTDSQGREWEVRQD